MKIQTIAAATALALVIAVPAFAHPGKGRGEHFGKADTNGDGVIARTEVEAAALAAFAGIDGNSDGFLTQEELKASMEARHAEMKGKRDGKRGHAMRGEGRGDFNIDDWIDPAKKAEWDAMKAERAAERDAKKAEHKAAMAAKAAEHFAAVDTDGDGRWSEAEFTTTRLEKFSKLDTDGDGNITAEERAAAKAKMKEHKGKWRDKPAAQ